MTKTAIITASGKGIGAACANKLASDGYHVVLMSPSGSACELAKKLGGTGLSGSTANRDDLAMLVATAKDIGPISAVVNNTGHPAKGNLLELDDESWHTGLDLVLLSVTRMAQLVTPIFIEQGSGSIVNISTFAAFEPNAAFPVSSCLRAALAAYCKLYADQYAVKNIRMNNVLPGYVDSFPEIEERVSQIPAGRYAKTSEIADAVAFLASDKASYITGQNLRVDGGITRSIG